MSINLKKLKNNLAKMSFGQTVEEARASGRCVNCGQRITIHPSIFHEAAPKPTDEEKRTPGIIYSYAGYKEINISGMCEACFDEITSDR